MKTDVSLQDRAAGALKAVFPNDDAFRMFLPDDPGGNILNSFIAFAVRHGLMETPDEKAFLTFIRSNARKPEDCIPPENLTFETFLESRKDRLQIHFSLRALTMRINNLLDTCGIRLPEISNTMLTRLKHEPADTAHKRNTLRAIAFWLGHERPMNGLEWNYQALLKMSPGVAPVVNFKEGVRVAFSLTSRGDVIGYEIVNWLRREIRDYIKTGIDRMPSGNWGTVHAHDLTTLFVDFPMEAGLSNPSSYQQSIRNGVALAHQTAIRWALSQFCNPKRFLAIGIAAGDFSGMDNYLLPLLSAKLPGDPVIRMSDYARQCVLINDIRVVFNQTPKEFILFNGETFYIWWVVGLWTMIYWDFIPRLMNEPVLADSPDAVTALTRLLWFSDELGREEAENCKLNAVTAYLRSPHNTLLGIEIAKTLYYRRRYWEANEILRIVISVYPFNLNARSFRMVIYRCLAVGAARYSEARIQFNRAEEEAAYIQKNCRTLNEDFYDEYAVIKLTRALMSLRFLRENKGEAVFPETTLTKGHVFELLDESEQLFEKGLTVSPTGIRTLYLVTCVRIIRRILKSNDAFFIDTEPDMTSQPSDVVQPAMDLFSALGWLREELDAPLSYEILYVVLERSFKIHRDAVMLSAYRPTIYYCYAVVLWDFFPVRTVGIARRVYGLLTEVVHMARALKNENLCIYSYTRCHGEMMPPDRFIVHITRGLDMIVSSVGGASVLETADEKAPVQSINGLRPLLFMQNI